MKIKIRSIFVFLLSLTLFFSTFNVCYAASPNVPKNFYVAVGGTLTIPTDLSTCQGKTKKWASNSNIISITSNGSVKGIKEGNATAYCTTNSSEIGITNVIVVPAANLSINKTEVTMSQNSSIKLNCSIKPNNAIKNVDWHSSNTAIAAVDSYGNVSSKSRNGSCIITCTSSDGTNNSVSCKLTVYSEETTTKKTEITTKKNITTTKKVNKDREKTSVTVKTTIPKISSEYITNKRIEKTTNSTTEAKTENNSENISEEDIETTTEKKVVKRVIVTDENNEDYDDIEFEVANESEYQLFAVSKKKNPIIIQWNEIENVDGYELYCADKSMQFSVIYCGSNNYYQKHYFENGKDYFFSVRGYKYVDNKKVYIESSEIIHIKAVKAPLFKF